MGALATMFAPAEKADGATLRREADLFSGRPLLRTVLDGIPDILLILNAQRQIVFANARAWEVLAPQSGAALLGLRPGELLECEHSRELPNGCGTTEACRGCGAARAILQAQAGHPSVRYFGVARSPNSEALDLQVHSRPLLLGGIKFVICVMIDVGDQKRREALEQVFLHDLSNSVAAVCGWAEVMAKDGLDDRDQLSRGLERLKVQAARVMDAMQAQKQLFAAERRELLLRPRPIEGRELIEEVASLALGLPPSAGKKIVVDPESERVDLVCDPALLRRVLLNMLKNAVEASVDGDTVSIGCARRGPDAEFWVRNPGVIPTAVQHRVFQRSFTTKGEGRGLGTYGMKLLGERYLGGRVSFASGPETGTIFKAVLPRARA